MEACFSQLTLDVIGKVMRGLAGILCLLLAHRRSRWLS